MGATLMATTSILLCSGLAAVISSTYSVKKPLSDAVYGAHGEFMVALKYVTLLTIFLFSFFCHSLSIRFINQVNILINTPQDPMSLVTPQYINEILEKGFILNTVGNRLFYAGLPLLLWIFGPVLVFLCSLTMVPVLYNLDFVFTTGKGKVEANQNRDFVWGYCVNISCNNNGELVNLYYVGWLDEWVRSEVGLSPHFDNKKCACMLSPLEWAFVMLTMISSFYKLGCE